MCCYMDVRHGKSSFNNKCIRKLAKIRLSDRDRNSDLWGRREQRTIGKEMMSRK